ncbi:ribonuclease HII [Bacillus suaedae]|uniref:Ribonuclease HII n=1 Tax=Halalkalibacter suaedae TaxID=2822140 RepID=A0A940WT79_9BACI|nr:ribonuclease HII [Bacillus suaedae]MBP3952055.1 ribonuclease HII [Bacillus suaedae]
MKLSIKELALKLEEEENEQLLNELRQDERKGVQMLLKRYEAKRNKKAELELMHLEMSVYENQLRQQGYSYIAGLDEVGRGPLAGPVVAAAVILPASFKLLGLTDSKKLSKQKREEFADIIKREAIAYAIEMIHAEEIDRINIYQSTKRAMQNAIKSLSTQPDYLLLDAMNLPLEIEQTSLIKGDQRSVSIAASSVLAKVERDAYMERLHKKYPNYGFVNHVGYGTQEHLHALHTFGLTEEHRRSFKPVQDVKINRE